LYINKVHRLQTLLALPVSAVTAVILCHNEALHIERCIRSVRRVASRIVVVDSGSTDGSGDLARALGATVLFNPWINHAHQFNWALDQLGTSTEWVLRIDADEYLSPALAVAISREVDRAHEEVGGFTVGRRIVFLGQPIRFGGLFPAQVLRLFRYGRGRCELRWMDEHIQVSGRVLSLEGELIDDNRKPLSWWIDKHNGYASKEAVEVLNARYAFAPLESAYAGASGSHAGRKRWVKNHIYNNLPSGLRAMCYFLYRYVLRLGFMDGRRGTAFHILQGFWYRYLVDQKVAEAERFHRESGTSWPQTVNLLFGIDLSSPEPTVLSTPP